MGAAIAERPDVPQPPQTLFGELFAAVQTAAIFADGKTFADAVPRAAPETILAAYRAAPPGTPAALERFVTAHFSLPEDGPSVAAPAATSLRAHIDALWSGLTRTSPSAPRWSSLLPLPQPYVVPGGRFREIYYWDSYFTMLGLRESRRADLIEGMVEDFAHLIDTYGHVPNGTRTYYLSRSQPPFFFAMVGLLADDPERGAGAAYARYLPQLKREYAFWMAGAESLKAGQAHRRAVSLPDGAILNRYWDDRDTPRDESYREDTELARASGRPAGELYRDIRAAAESGWDFSSRWFADARTMATLVTTDIVPVDLNSLLFGLENAHRRGLRARGRCPRRQRLSASRGGAARGARPLPLGRCGRRLLRLPDRRASAHPAALGRDALSALSRLRLGAAGAGRGRGGACIAPQVRRSRDDAARDRTAVGCAQWLGAIAMDRRGGFQSLR